MEKWFFVDATTLRQALGEWDGGTDPLYEQLAAKLERCIETGELPPGARLPSERQLARALGVSRGTVVASYRRLRDADLLRSRQGSGSVVAGVPVPARDDGEMGITALLGLNVASSIEAGRDFVNLRSACWSDASDLPVDVFDLAGEDLDQALASHGYHTGGLPELRAALAAYFSSRGLLTVPDQVLVTAGAQQAIVLLAGLVLSAGDTVVSEALTYPGARDAFRVAGARIVGAPLGPSGVLLDELARCVAETRPRLVYLIPTIHNPTGVVMPPECRERLAALASGWDAVVIDDESLAETVLTGSPPAPLAAFARDPASVSRLFTVGSASKSFWGGLRVGWIRGPEPAIAQLTRLKTLADLASPVLSQLVTTRLLERGPDVLELRRGSLGRRLDAVAGALAEHLSDWEWTPPASGLSFWVRVPDTDGTELSHVAARYGVGVVPGAVCSVDGSARDHLRLGLGPSPERLVEGVRRLAEAWRAHREGHGQPRRLEVIV